MSYGHSGTDSFICYVSCVGTSVISVHFAFLKSKSKEPKQAGLWQALTGNGQ